MKHSRVRHAVTLVELMLVIGVAVVFAAVADPLVRWTFVTMRETGRSVERTGIVDSALQVMKSDVWRASSIEADANHLTLKREGSQVSWRLEGDDLVRQADGETLPREFMGVGKSLRFELERPFVRVEVPAGYYTPSRTVWLSPAIGTAFAEGRR